MLELITRLSWHNMAHPVYFGRFNSLPVEDKTWCRLWSEAVLLKLGSFETRDMTRLAGEWPCCSSDIFFVGICVGISYDFHIKSMMIDHMKSEQESLVFDWSSLFVTNWFESLGWWMEMFSSGNHGTDRQTWVFRVICSHQPRLWIEIFNVLDFERWARNVIWAFATVHYRDERFLARFCKELIALPSDMTWVWEDVATFPIEL